jgi:hypothetical protein
MVDDPGKMAVELLSNRLIDESIEQGLVFPLWLCEWLILFTCTDEEDRLLRSSVGLIVVTGFLQDSLLCLSLIDDRLLRSTWTDDAPSIFEREEDLFPYKHIHPKCPRSRWWLAPTCVSRFRKWVTDTLDAILAIEKQNQVMTFLVLSLF